MCAWYIDSYKPLQRNEFHDISGFRSFWLHVDCRRIVSVRSNDRTPMATIPDSTRWRKAKMKFKRDGLRQRTIVNSTSICSIGNVVSHFTLLTRSTETTEECLEEEEPHKCWYSGKANVCACVCICVWYMCVKRLRHIRAQFFIVVVVHLAFYGHRCLQFIG